MTYTAPRMNGQAAASENGLPPEIVLVPYALNGSINDPLKPRGLSLIHSVSGAPNPSFLCNILLNLLFVHEV